MSEYVVTFHGGRTVLVTAVDVVHASFVAEELYPDEVFMGARPRPRRETHAAW